MTDYRVRFRHLQCFLSIAQHRSVGAAADALAITQPALSKTLRELEEALDTKLFARDRKGMLLTRTGEIFLEYAAASVAAMHTGVNRIRSVGGRSDRKITLGVLPTVAARLMPEVAQRFKRQFSNTTVRVVTGENAQLLDLLRLAEVELVVGRLARPESMIGLTFEELYVEPLTIVVRPTHPLVGRKRSKIAEIGDYPCILPPPGTIIRDEIDRFLIGRGVPRPLDVVEATSIAFLRGYATMVDAVWFVPFGMVAPDLREKRFVELKFDTTAMRGPVGISLRAGLEPSAPVSAMIATIRSAALSLR